jgi:hypothetical protein
MELRLHFTVCELSDVSNRGCGIRAAAPSSLGNRFDVDIEAAACGVLQSRSDLRLPSTGACTSYYIRSRKISGAEDEDERGGGLPVLFQRITSRAALNRIPANFRHINGRHPARTRVPAIYLTVPPRFG